MKYIILSLALLWALSCVAVPSLAISAGSMSFSNNAHITVTGGAVTNSTSGTPFYAVNTLPCSTATTFRGPEGELDALTITPAGDMGSTTVDIYSGSYHPNTTSSVLGWWKINPTASQICTLQFRFRSSYLGSLNPANLAVWEYSGTWVKLSEASTTVGPTFTTITFTNVNFVATKAAHQIVIADKNDATLPVELSYFNATAQSDGKVSLLWVSQSENNLLGYYVWRSEDEYLINTELVSPLITATNTSNQQSYLFIDESLTESGIWYYWLQSQNLDGSGDYYGSVAVDVHLYNPGTPPIPLKTALNKLYPNPFNPSLAISYSLKNKAACEISILNLKGQKVRILQSNETDAGNYTLRWDGTDATGQSCSSGIYFVRMQAGSETFIQRAMLMK